MRSESEQLLDYFQIIKRHPILSKEQETELFCQLRTGSFSEKEEARKRLIYSNVRLVVSIAQKQKRDPSKMSLVDLVQEGMFGLFRAIEKFEPERGFKFSTYAYWWINQAVSRALKNQGNIIRLPVYLNDRLHQIRKASADLASELGRMPARREVATQLNMQPDRLDRVLKETAQPISFETSISVLKRGFRNESEELNIGAIIACSKPKPEEVLLHQELTEQVNLLLTNAGLTEREQEIVQLLFGLNGRKELKAKQIAALYGVSDKRIGQIKKKAIQRLRQAVRKQGGRK